MADSDSKLIKIVVALLVTAILVYTLPKLLACLLPFILAWIVSLIIKPVVKLLEKVHIHRRIAVVVSMLAIISLISVAVYGISVAVIEETKEVMAMLEDTRDGIPVFVWDTVKNFPRPVKNAVFNVVRQISDQGASFFYPAIQSALPKLGGVAGKIPGAFVFFIVFMLAVYFISYDTDSVKKAFRKIVPGNKLAYFRNARNTFLKVCGGYIKAQLIIMTVVFTILLTGFLILDVKLAIILAFLISIIDAIPVLGTGIILNPWAVICLIQGNYIRAIGFVCLYLVVLVTRQIIEPRILSSKLGMHPILTLITMYSGFKLIGVLGMILGPMVALIVYNLINTNALEDVSDAKEEI